MPPAIRVDHLSKQYRLGLTHAGSIRELVAQASRRLMGRNYGLRPDLRGRATGEGRPIDEENCFWALRDVSFDIQHGEVVGVIGRNGAGKSTLLKILSRITSPTEGRVEINGRVASLLEVGTGFHPELTGRENVFLNGAILGMTKAEIRKKFDEIVAFSEIEEFIDTPVKRYSSGMYVRLAFAVAAHLEPEILLVDEVLAVGDVSFQKRCLNKMEDVARCGRTVVFVSHQMPAVESLTQRCLLFEQGQLQMFDRTGDVVTRYLEKSAQSGKTALAEWSDRQGNRDMAMVKEFAVLDSLGQGTRIVRTGESFQLEVVVEFHSPVIADVAIVVENARSVPLFTSALSDRHRLEKRSGQIAYRVTVDPNHLKPGAYLVTLCVSSAKAVYHDIVLHYPAFRVQSPSGGPDIACDNRWGDFLYPFTWNVRLCDD